MRLVTLLILRYKFLNKMDRVLRGNDHVPFFKSTLFKKLIRDLALSFTIQIPFKDFRIRGEMLGGRYEYSLN